MASPTHIGHARCVSPVFGSRVGHTRPLRSYLQVRRPLRCSSINTVILSSLSNPESRDPLAKSVRPSATSVTDPATAGTNLKEFKLLAGKPEPLGPSVAAIGGKIGVNFALFSQHGTKVTLVLFDEDDNVLEEVPVKARTGDVWHVFVEALPLANICYGYKVEGPQGWSGGHRFQPDKIFLDPYAPLVKGRSLFGIRDEYEKFQPVEGSVFRGTYDFIEEEYDWGDDYQVPNIPKGKLVIYEMVIRSFTADPSSGVGAGVEGTFKGVEAKIPFLKELGVNCVELLPVFEYDELEFQRSKNPRDHMVNIWGYSHLSFFAPNSRFAAHAGGPVAARRELKDLVKAFHAAGIKVILDVVYNHTVEGGDDDPYPLSWRGIDNVVYYMVDPEQYVQLVNYSGCGNTVSGNHPVTKRMIVDSLRQWVEDYHVDGFRFDLASCLCRDPRGRPIPAPPLIEEIAKDPILSETILIAEPWDCGGLYQVGTFPNWDVWGEWNGKYRDVVRAFIRGDTGLKGQFATRLCGSADLYQVNNRKPYQNVNFVIAHDGFTLYDLVSYNEKRNGDNGESNKDGTNDNVSWNCGVEGETDDEGVKQLRRQQMRNLMVALMVSQGTPMVLSGDEYGQTRWGNNNWYGHDNKMTRYDWDALEAQRDDFFRFYSLLVKFRIAHPLLGRDNFLSLQDIHWHETNWDNHESKFLAFSLLDRGQGCGDLYVAFNTHDYKINVPLPPAGPGRKWARIVDTSLPAPRDFTESPIPKLEGTYGVNGYSSVILTSVAV